MKTLLIIVSILLIAIVLLQAGKAEGASAAMMGGNDSLFKNRKERGGELFITMFYNGILISHFFL